MSQPKAKSAPKPVKVAAEPAKAKPNGAIDEAKVKSVLNKLRGNLQADGGDLEYLGLKGKVVQIRLTGHCAGCMHAQMTLKMGIERILKQEVPNIESVEAVE